MDNPDNLPIKLIIKKKGCFYLKVDLVQKTKQAIDIAKNEAKQQPCLIPVEPLPKAEPKVSTSLSFSIEQGETGFSEELLIKALTDPRHEIRHVAKIGDQPKL
jgi:hypothetical protein